GGGSRLVGGTAERCRRSLTGAAECLSRALTVTATGEHDLVAIEVRTALDAIGRVAGSVVTDDVLDRIFGQFCIGK
ncbi:MAG: tRNA uridine-5-carboxymethylaminomethyl(34) synthesis GTPase MnmE, partial [Planctomycetota bacterium]